MQRLSSKKHLRIIPELRAMHVEESTKMFPCDVLYFAEKYDLGSTLLPINFRKVGLATAIAALMRSSATVLEVPEPLWLRCLPKTYILLVVWRLRSRFTSTKRFAVSYAIENNDLHSLFGGGRKLPQWLVRSLARVIGALISPLLDRLAFGSDGAEHTYGLLPLRSSLETCVVLDLPVQSSTPDLAHRGARMAAVFVGQMEERKGILELMSIWPQVESRFDHAVLTVVGDGDLETQLREWALERPQSRNVLGKIEHGDLGQVLIVNDVLIAPSRRVGRWKEQIGLPICEALSYGLTIVSSSDTGLAEWLQSQGHHVVSPDRFLSDLPTALGEALVSPLSRLAVRQSLPLRSGRIVADHWIHAVEPDGDK